MKSLNSYLIKLSYYYYFHSRKLHERWQLEKKKTKNGCGIYSKGSSRRWQWKISQLCGFRNFPGNLNPATNTRQQYQAEIKNFALDFERTSKVNFYTTLFNNIFFFMVNHRENERAMKYYLDFRNFLKTNYMKDMKNTKTVSCRYRNFQCYSLRLSKTLPFCIVFMKMWMCTKVDNTWK